MTRPAPRSLFGWGARCARAPYPGVAGPRSTLLRKVQAGLAAGRPVLAAGTVDPPECWVVTGYGQGGDVLHGWSCFQEEPRSEPSARPDGFDKSEWATDVGNTVAGRKKPGPLPSKRQVLERTLRLAIDVVHRRAAADPYDTVSSEAWPTYPWGPNWTPPDLADSPARHIRLATDPERRAVAELGLALRP